jgi:ABC-type sugar transport system ATPase subunit
VAVLIQVRDLSKSFPGVRALDGVSLDVEQGSCHALIGENGAGKSTLGKILAGLYQPDSGTILLDGKPVKFRSPRDATDAGIGMVHQELLFCENLSVFENLNLHAPPHAGLFYKFKKAQENAADWLAKIGADVDPRQQVGELSVAKQQLVQIAGAIALGARVLIFDEPTSSLSQVEAEKLMTLIDHVKSSGVTCIYVSHRLEEIFRICDRVTVLRDGKLICTEAVKDVDRPHLIEKMVGRELILTAAPAQPAPEAKELLTVKNLVVPGRVQGISFSARAGEIVGIAGLVGAGRTETLEAIFGLDNRCSGEITLNGQPYRPTSPDKALRAGIGLIPEDRKRHGLVLMMNAKENISLPVLDRLSAAGFTKSGEEKDLAARYFDRLRVKAPSIESSSAGLSGGNQQKLVLAKWVAAQCDVLLVDEPTRGVDIGAKAEIHALLRELAGQGKALVVASSELPELLAICTRILVLREGRLVGEMDSNIANETALMRMMAGVAVA